MAKVIVTLNGLLQQEISILKPRLTIGRRSNNDLVLDQLTVSGQHAAIDTTSIGVFILDLGSTNGTLVNGQPITKHLLQHDDVLEIGKYKIRYQHDGINFESLKLKDDFAPLATSTVISDMVECPIFAKIKLLNGCNAGREMRLQKIVTTFGIQGVSVISITRRLGRYYIAHVEGHSFAKINEQILSSSSNQILSDGDRIEISDAHMVFLVDASQR